MFRVAAVASLALALGLATFVHADSRPDVTAQCGWTPAQTKGNSVEAARAAEIATSSYVEARLVFVGFPSHSQVLPVWADSMASELSDYITTMSRGAQTLHLSVLRRTDVPTDAWVADHDASYYAPFTYGTWDQYGYGYGVLNTEIMNKVATQQSGVWTGVQMVFM